MTAYLSGPMSGHTDLNFPAFTEAARRLRSAGMHIISPHEHQETGPAKPWTYYLRKDIRLMLDCDTIIMLTGWRNSRGAVLERHIAAELGMRIRELADVYHDLAHRKVTKPSAVVRIGGRR
ncbi:DUF4406 domain-containing protein [Gordonia sp. SND2]|uniref:DUF4406 domain-containing protein n=1 Tax=Gordonia sp. SND2 TaxID=3388659 RepID=UPI00398B82D7